MNRLPWCTTRYRLKEGIHLVYGEHHYDTFYEWKTAPLPLPYPPSAHFSRRRSSKTSRALRKPWGCRSRASVAYLAVSRTSSALGFLYVAAAAWNSRRPAPISAHEPPAS